VKNIWNAEVNKRQLKQEQHHRLKDLSQYLREEAGINYQSMTGSQDPHVLPKGLYVNELCYYFPLSLPCGVSCARTHSSPLLFPFFSFLSIFPFSFPFTYYLDPSNLTQQPLGQPSWSS